MLLLQLIGQSFLIAVLWTSVSGVRDFDLVKFEVEHLSDIPAIVTVKMFRNENRDHIFNMTLNVTSDDLEVYDVEVALQRSTLGNNQFILRPFKIPRKRLCDVFNNEYRNRVMDDVTKHSNLPCEHDRTINYCNLLKKGYPYELINYGGNVTFFSPFTPAGTYKFVGSLINRNTNEVVLSVLVLSTLY